MSSVLLSKRGLVTTSPMDVCPIRQPCLNLSALSCLCVIETAGIGSLWLIAFYRRLLLERIFTCVEDLSDVLF